MRDSWSFSTWCRDEICQGRKKIDVTMKLCQCVLDEILNRWRTSLWVPIFKGSGEVKNYVFRKVKVLEHAMNILKRVLERRI